MKKRLLKTFFILSSILFTSCGTTTSASFVVRGSYSSKELASNSITTTGSPKSLTLKIYAIYLGTRSDCTDLKPILDMGDTGTEYDLYANPLFASANPEANTYNCIAIKIQDVISARMNPVAIEAWGGVCFADTDYSKDLYPLSTTPLWKDIKGAAVTAEGSNTIPVSNKITLFGTTDKTAAAEGSLALSAAQLFTLASAITIPNKTTFYIDYTEGINGSTNCTLTTGTMGFR